jgi:hypothetical protein
MRRLSLYSATKDKSPCWHKGAGGSHAAGGERLLHGGTMAAHLRCKVPSHSPAPQDMRLAVWIGGGILFCAT